MNELRVSYKVLTYTYVYLYYRAIHNTAPSHLYSLINVSKPVRITRSSTKKAMVVPKIALNR